MPWTLTIDLILIFYIDIQSTLMENLACRLLEIAILFTPKSYYPQNYDWILRLNISMSVWLIYVLKRKHRICFGILDIQCHVVDLLMNKEVAVKVGTRAKLKILKCMISTSFYTHFIKLTFFLFSNFFLSSFHSFNLIWKHDIIYYCIKMMSFFMNIDRCLYL